MEGEWPQPTKLDVYETADYTRSFDLALLTETRCEGLMFSTDTANSASRF